jgi:DNA-binding PadR family transcriptional regulator
LNTGSVNRIGTGAPDNARIAILGLLARYGPKHGYDLRRLIQEQNIDFFANVQLGSIYAAIKKLAADGLIRARRSRENGQGPPRTVYAITASGSRELRALLARALTEAAQRERPIDLAVHFSGLLDVEELRALLGRRLERLERAQANIDALAAGTHHPSPAVQAIVTDLAEHYRLVNEAERTWTRSLLQRLETETYAMPSDRPLKPARSK